MKILCNDLEKLKKLSENSSLSNDDISKEFNISKSTLWNWYKFYGINRLSIRNNEGKMPDKSILEAEYKHSNASELARKYGVTPATILKWLKKYDIETKSFKNIRNSDIYKAKYETTCIEKYGHDTPLKNNDIQEKMKNAYNSKYGYKSKGELDIINTLNKELNINLQPSRLILKNGRELDGYDENNNIAIEYCGLYWHSEKGGKTKNYHYDKWKECYDKGIKLYTIYEDEWKNKKDKIIKYIYMNCGKAETIIYARNTKFIELSKKIANDYCDQHHLQNHSRITNAYGLIHNDEIVSCMTFGKHHRNNSIMVMNRYCGKYDVRVIGGASKLIENACRFMNVDELITWSDNRWSDGNLYKSIGCELEQILGPEYDWTNFYERYSKQSRKKSSTKQPIHLTEKEYNESLGLSRIWDCGKMRWIYKKRGE